MVEEQLLNAFDDLSIENKRNEINVLLMKADMLFENLGFENKIHREVKNYVYSDEDENIYLNELYRNVYNLVQNITDYAYYIYNIRSNENS